MTAGELSGRSRRCHGRTGPLAAGRALAARFAARSAAQGESEGQEAWGTGAPATCAARTDLSLVHPIGRPLARGAVRETAAAPVLTAVAPLAVREMCSEPAGTDRRIGASGPPPLLAVLPPVVGVVRRAAAQPALLPAADTTLTQRQCCAMLGGGQRARVAVARVVGGSGEAMGQF